MQNEHIVYLYTYTCVMSLTIEAVALYPSERPCCRLSCVCNICISDMMSRRHWSTLRSICTSIPFSITRLLSSVTSSVISFRNWDKMYESINGKHFNSSIDLESISEFCDQSYLLFNLIIEL